MSLIAFAQVRPRRNATDSHFAHVPLDSLAVNLTPFSSQCNCDTTAAIERKLCVNLVNTMFDCHLFCRWLDWLIVKTSTAHTQQLDLDSEGQL